MRVLLLLLSPRRVCEIGFSEKLGGVTDIPLANVRIECSGAAARWND